MSWIIQFARICFECTRNRYYGKGIMFLRVSWPKSWIWFVACEQIQVFSFEHHQLHRISLAFDRVVAIRQTTIWRAQNSFNHQALDGCLLLPGLHFPDSQIGVGWMVLKIVDHVAAARRLLCSFFHFWKLDTNSPRKNKRSSRHVLHMNRQYSLFTASVLARLTYKCILYIHYLDKLSC